MIQFQENTWTARQKDGQTLFHRSIPATTDGPTSTTAVDWYLKAKDIEQNVDLTKNYCNTVSMQKTSSIHTLNLMIQQTLGSRELNGQIHFGPNPP